MRQVAETVELVKGDDYVIVEVGSRAHEHFSALEYLVKGEVVEGEVVEGVEEKVKQKRRVKAPSPAQT